MEPREIRDRIWWMGAMDWDRRWFDALVPTPEGTSYNAWLVRGSRATALLDTVDGAFADRLLGQLAEVDRVDYVVAHHAEQDHSGALPAVLQRFPEARVLCTPRCATFLQDLLPVPGDRLRPVADGEEVSLGDRTLRFLHMPWVHWPETMVTHLPEEGILFSCDFFGSHLATPELVVDADRLLEPARRYYAEIMMPFRGQIAKHLQRVSGLGLSLICPSHGPMHPDPAFIVDTWSRWVSAPPRNAVLIPYVSMHGSTGRLVDRLVASLASRKIPATPANLLVTDLGALAMALVDPMTVVFASPVVLNGLHPLVQQAAYTASLLKPKARHVAMMSSFSWGGRLEEQLQGILSGWKVEFLPGVACKGLPREDALAAVDALADAIASRHRSAD